MASVHALPGPRIARRPTSISTTDRMRRSACLSAALRTKVQRRQCRLPDRVTVVGRGRRRRMWIRIVVVTVVGRGRRRRMWIPIVVVFVMMRGRRVRSRCIPGRCRPHRMWFRIVVVTVVERGRRTALAHRTVRPGTRCRPISHRDRNTLVDSYFRLVRVITRCDLARQVKLRRMARHSRPQTAATDRRHRTVGRVMLHGSDTPARSHGTSAGSPGPGYASRADCWS